MPAAIPLIIQAVAYIGGGNLIAGLVEVGLAIATQFLGSKPKRGATGRQDNTLMVRETAFPRREVYGRSRVGGVWFYAQTAGVDNVDLYLVLGICEGEIEGVETIYFGESALSVNPDGSVNGQYAGSVTAHIHTGSDTQAADTMLETDLGAWTSDHKLSGIAYVAFKLTHSTETFPNGLPEISFVVKGRKDIYDPRTDSTGYTANPALCLNHFLTVSRWGAGAHYATEIDEPALIAAANICDETTDTLNGVEKRYECNGIVSSDSTIEDNLGLIRQSMAGWVIYSGGRFRISAGSYHVPTFAINPDMILNVKRHQTRKPRRDRVNTVKGLYISELNQWQESDFPPAKNATYITADGGDELPLDIQLPLTQSPPMAQRLAKIELETARLERTLSLECSLRALPVVAGSSVMLTFPRYGYTNKVFQCIASEVRPGSGTTPPTVSLELREWSADVFAWDSSTEETEVEPSPFIPNAGQKLPLITVTIKRLNGSVIKTYTVERATYLRVYVYESVNIELTNSDTEASIAYTHSFTFANYPILTAPENGTIYTAPILLNQPHSENYIQALAFRDGYSNSHLLRLQMSLR